MTDILERARDTLDELIRMTDLVSKLLEVLSVSVLRVRKFEREHNIPLDHETECLLNQATILYEELNTKQKSKPFILGLADESLQRKKTAKDFLKP